MIVMLHVTEAAKRNTHTRSNRVSVHYYLRYYSDLLSKKQPYSRRIRLLFAERVT